MTKSASLPPFYVATAKDAIAFGEDMAWHFSRGGKGVFKITVEIVSAAVPVERNADPEEN
jgi:hypothetical protein